MKLLNDKIIIFCFIWGILLYIVGLVNSYFYLLPLGLLPFALYEFWRTEGIINTKPLSLLVSATLIFQFLHTSKIYKFPYDVKFLLDILPIPIPTQIDPFIFLSVALLIIFSLLLLRYTWGSVTKFLSIALLAGTLIQAYLFWPEIQIMLQSPQGQNLLEGSKERIKENFFYRLRREIF